MEFQIISDEEKLYQLIRWIFERVDYPNDSKSMWEV